MITVHHREALLVRKDFIPIEVRKEIVQKYSFRFYEEKACDGCEFGDERRASYDKHLDICDQCAAFKGGADLASSVEIKGKKYIKAPAGDKPNFLKLLKRNGLQFKIKNHTPDIPMKRPFKFTGTLKPFQDDAVDAIFEKMRGVIKAPPRSGKTVIGAAATCDLASKTIIVASQREWLNGFRETFVGSNTQKALTSCKPSQIGFCKTLEEFEKYDVCLVTPQTFLSEKGQKLLREIRDMFTVMIIDEIHTGAAPKYAKVISSMNVRYLIGLSGTPSRKDGRYVIMRNLVGPIIFEAKVERLRPRVRLVRTKYQFKAKGMVPWVRLVSNLENNPERLKLIAEWAVRDAKNGHMILIPMAQIKPIKALVLAINKIAGKEIAKPFIGSLKKKDRDDFLEWARTYKIKVLVGSFKLLSTGTNIPRASCLYDVSLSSNKENCEQRTARVLTPWDDKPDPLTRYFLDDMPVRRRCLQMEWYQVVRPKFKPIISDSDTEVLNSYFRSKDQQETAGWD
jgi:superfamily II DNA or RNA helicase